MKKQKKTYPPKKEEQTIFKKNIQHKWSEYQKNIFKNIARGVGHTIVIARAGSSKTSTLVEGAKYIPKGKKSLFVAFNKNIQEELKSRLPSYVECMTLHSLGLRGIKLKFPNVEVNYYKCQNMIETFIENKKENYELIDAIKKTVSLCKANLADTPRLIEEIIVKYDIDLDNTPLAEFIQHVSKTLRLCKEFTKEVDFDDMIWFPIIYRINVGKYDYVFADETQDLNKCQVELALSSCKIDGRVIVLMDPFQCVSENTKLETINGYKAIKDINIGDKVSSYENGNIVLNKVLNKTKSDWDFGIKIITETGKELMMSPNHKIWAESSVIDSKQNSLAEDFLFKQNENKLLLKISSNSLQGTCVDLEFFDIKIKQILEKSFQISSYKRSDNISHYGIKCFYKRYADAIKFSNDLQAIFNTSVVDIISFDKDSEFKLLSANSLVKGMTVLINNKGNISPEKIKKITIEKSEFFDISVENCANFFGNDILSHNCIYSWRGADSSVYDNLKNRLKPIELSLPICYRCPKKVVALCKNYVEDIIPFEQSKEGEISHVNINDLIKMAKPGDYVISRFNAPLIKNCMKFLKNKIPANILGRDIGENLSNMLKKSKKKDIKTFLEWLKKWESEEKENLLIKYPKASTENISDKAECLRTLCEDSATLEDVKKNISKLFQENEESKIVLFSSIHKIKGKETNNVFVLTDTLSETSQEEKNLCYVAFSRSKSKLFLVAKNLENEFLGARTWNFSEDNLQ